MPPPTLSPPPYQWSDQHPDKVRLVFSTQLHQELRNLAKHREITPAPQHNHHHGHGGINIRPVATPEINGWDLEKKMVALREVRELLQRPFFLYADWGTAAGSAAAQSERRIPYVSYFNKTLALQIGQTTLLDLWDYLMDMCEFVPVRNRCRSLYLHAAACICRRVEFIDGYEMDGETITLSEQLSERYHKMLARCVTFCGDKLLKSRFLSEEHRSFISHIFTAVYFRFPRFAEPILKAVVDATAILDEGGRASESVERNSGLQSPSVASLVVYNDAPPPRKRPNKDARLSSPRAYRRHWHALPQEDLDQHQNQRASIQDRVHASFVEYKAHRHASSGFGLPSKHKHSHRSSIAAALEVAFEQGAANVKQEEEALFIRRLPLLYSGNVNQQAAFSKMAISEADIAAAVAAFVDIIRAPARDDLLVVIFVAAFMSDVACWCSRRRASPQERILWHCVPGYFCLVRAYLSAFKRMCQRRPRMPSATPTPSMTVGRVLSLLDGRQTDPWVTYWSTREIDTLMDAAGDVMRNERLVNVLVQAVLNGTNILDPTNVNYSFGLLQRLLEVAARSAIPLNGVVDTAAGKQSPRQLLDATFDVDSFMSAMRNALNSVHVQILLKVLTFLYNCIELLPTTARKRLLGELILRENFFRFFLHWNEEIRKIYCYLVVFKTAASNRLDLPSSSDRVLLAHSPYFEAQPVTPAASSSSPAAPSYWAHISEMAQTMLRPNGNNDMDAAKKNATGANALKRLIEWDGSARVKRNHKGAHDAVFHDSLVDEELSVDLSIVSKLDALFKMISDQMNRSHATPSAYFPVTYEAYAERAVSQYVAVLWEYYEDAFEEPSCTPLAPTLEFTITMPFGSD